MSQNPKIPKKRWYTKPAFQHHENLNASRWFGKVANINRKKRNSLLRHGICSLWDSYRPSFVWNCVVKNCIRGESETPSKWPWSKLSRWRYYRCSHSLYLNQCMYFVLEWPWIIPFTNIVVFVLRTFCLQSLNVIKRSVSDKREYSVVYGINQFFVKFQINLWKNLHFRFLVRYTPMHSFESSIERRFIQIKIGLNINQFSSNFSIRFELNRCRY